MTQIRIAQKKIKRSWWPLIGFLLIVSIALVSYFLAPSVVEVTQRALPRLNTSSIKPEMLRLIFAAVTFGILILIVGLIVALFAPRRRTLVKETDLVKEREAMLREKEKDKEKQRSVNIAIRKEMREQDPRSGKVE